MVAPPTPPLIDIFNSEELYKNSHFTTILPPESERRFPMVTQRKEFLMHFAPMIAFVVTGLSWFAWYFFFGSIPKTHTAILWNKQLNLPFNVSRLWDIPLAGIITYGFIRSLSTRWVHAMNLRRLILVGACFGLCVETLISIELLVAISFIVGFTLVYVAGEDIGPKDALKLSFGIGLGLAIGTGFGFSLVYGAFAGLAFGIVVGTFLGLFLGIVAYTGGFLNVLSALVCKFVFWIRQSQ